MSGRDSFAVDDYAPGGGAMEEARSRKSPLVLMGAGLTAAVLGAGLFSFYRGNQATAQVMMRARVIAQGATVFLMLGTTMGAAGEVGARLPFGGGAGLRGGGKNKEEGESFGADLGADSGIASAAAASLRKKRGE